INKILGENSHLSFKQKVVRAGKGKIRGRKYKSNAGLLFIVSKDEKKSFKGLDVKTIFEIKISDLYPLGRLAIYTKNAIQEIKELESKK
ncbi:MAG: hypothetical protein AABY10_01615, partial [Nanoarchaeota archaeon]